MTYRLQYSDNAEKEANTEANSTSEFESLFEHSSEDDISSGSSDAYDPDKNKNDHSSNKSKEDDDEVDVEVKSTKQHRCDSGLGHELARRLDALGVPVFAGCLFPEGPGASRLAADCSSRLRLLPLDVTSDQQVADAVASVQAALSAASGTELWAVVNNAGISDVGEVDVMPLEKFQQVLDVNTMGAIRVSKAFLSLLKKSKGRLINVTSPLGK
ncbi:estradiol 17-beta-dehydrogenase 2-like [Schistocerca cancellata]|uniref:estradiol 17-beta-dehydrogenase 2-like n=1 Tax=Schistocerca cancellata TaxID=274614 RepID=UPI002118E480|nr:estradiol 17-beta-dehydrogenase 2-like [Schistocerca cancellata]